MTIPCNHSFNTAPQPSPRPWVKTLALVIVAALISGCSVVHPPPGTPLEVPARFSHSGESTLPDQWWLSFKDPVLNSLMDQALADNFDLKTAWDRLLQAQALARSAGADLVPTLDVGAENSRNR